MPENRTISERDTIDDDAHEQCSEDMLLWPKSRWESLEAAIGVPT